MSDIEEMDVDSDVENEMQDLEQLNAVLVNDVPCSTSSISHGAPMSSTSGYTLSTNYEEYSKIEAAIALNKMCDDKLRRLERLLQTRLQECHRRLSEVQDTSDSTYRNGIESFRYVYCGKPYFKDKNNFPAPDNNDTLLMAKSEMYNFSSIASVPGWTVKDKSQLTTQIYKLSKDKKKKELCSQIAQLQRHSKLPQMDKNEKKITALKKEMEKLNKMSLKQLALPIEQEYDWDYIANKLNYRHSAQEYRALWKLFLHPSINKNIWTKSEHIILQKIAFEKKLQDWDTIASELRTRRTNYQCFVYFRTNMNNTFTSRKWTKEEEEYLKRLIEYYREDNYIPWGKVAASMENRTKVQIYNKYARLCELRKGKFLPEEDAVILTCIDHFGPNFKKVTEYLQGRSITQCRDRFAVLNKKRISAVWTVAEDKKLVQLMANQDISTNYSNISQYFPGKDRVNIRTRYITLSKWMRRNPNRDISHAPRRGARRLGHGKSTEDLNRAIESLKSRLQLEVTEQKSKKITKDSPEEVIDDAILAILTNENTRKIEAQKLQAYQEEQDSSVGNSGPQKFNVTNLRTILIMLKAKLNRQKFSKSVLRNLYQGLLNPDEKLQTVKVRSYSKKEAVRSLNIDRTSDVWGANPLGQLAYVLPPHYATITGCRKLMSHYVRPRIENEEIKNINLVIKRNMVLKDQVDTLMERFNSLFLWPMLLSNATPDDCKGNEKITLPKSRKKYPVFQKEDYNFALPKENMSKNVVNEEIDMEESEDNHKIEIDDNFYNSDKF